MARSFAVAASVQDPLLAERLVETLAARGLEAFARAGGAASSAAFAQAQAAFWDVLVASESAAQAEACVAQVLEELEREAESNAAAADEESQTPAGGGRHSPASGSDDSSGS